MSFFSQGYSTYIYSLRFQYKKAASMSKSEENDHHQWDLKCDVIHDQWTVFREMNSGNLTMATCYESSMIHTIAINFNCPFAFYVPAIWKGKMIVHIPPYLLLVHVIEFLLNGLLQFSSWLGIRIVPGFIECLWFFLCMLHIFCYHGSSS